MLLWKDHIHFLLSLDYNKQGFKKCCGLQVALIALKAKLCCQQVAVVSEDGRRDGSLGFLDLQESVQTRLKELRK